jgi:hypothetical protein
MPLIHQENCTFSSLDFPMLEKTSISTLTEKAIKPMSDIVRGEESFRRHRKKPFASTSMNQHFNNTSFNNNKSLKSMDNNFSNFKKGDKRNAIKTPIKNSSPPTKTYGKRNDFIVKKGALNLSMECLPSTSQSIITKNLKVKSKITVNHFDISKMFKNRRPELNFVDEYKDDKDLCSIPPFVKCQQSIDDEEEDDNFDLQKHKKKSIKICKSIFPLLNPIFFYRR